MDQEFIDAVKSHIHLDGLTDFARRARYRVVAALGEHMPAEVVLSLVELEKAYDKAHKLMDHYGLLPYEIGEEDD